MSLVLHGTLRRSTLLCYLGLLHNSIELYTTYVACGNASVIALLLVCGYRPREIVSYIAGRETLRGIYDALTSDMDPRKANIDYLTRLVTTKLGYVPTLGELEALTSKCLVLRAYNATLCKVVTFPDDVSCVLATVAASTVPHLEPKMSVGGMYYYASSDVGPTCGFVMCSAPSTIPTTDKLSAMLNILIDTMKMDGDIVVPDDDITEEEAYVQGLTRTVVNPQGLRSTCRE